MQEAKIEKYIKEKIEKLSGMYLKFTSPGTNGVPDRIVLLAGQIRFVELKAPGKKPRKLQRYIHEQIKEQGFDVWVIDSISGADEFIKSLGGGKSEV